MPLPRATFSVTARVVRTGCPAGSRSATALPPNTTVEWKCVKRQDAGYPNTADLWQPGANTTFSTPATGSAGTTSGSF